VSFLGIAFAGSEVGWLRREFRHAFERVAFDVANDAEFFGELRSDRLDAIFCFSILALVNYSWFLLTNRCVGLMMLCFGLFGRGRFCLISFCDEYVDDGLRGVVGIWSGIYVEY
jgi:hypothetical protein